jgi:hypothetical protein
MPQLQLPIFPAGAKCITNEIAAECRDKQVVYLYGSLLVFQHAEGDLQSFRLITSQLIDMGAVRQVDIVNAFGVPLPTVKRYLKLLRDRGSKAFFAEPKRRSASVLRGEARQLAERLIEEGRSVPEVAQASGVKANTLHKAIRAGRLPAVKKNRPSPVGAHVVQQGCELQLPILLRCFSHTLQPAWPAFPARCPVQVWLPRVLLGQRPSRRNLWRWLAFVRLLRRYYAAVRLPAAMHVGLNAHRSPTGPSTAHGRLRGLPVLAHGVSLHAWGLRLRRAAPHSRCRAPRCGLPCCLTPSAPCTT